MSYHISLRSGLLAFALCLVIPVPRATAEVKLPAALGSHMVLQRDLPVPLWGTAAPGEKVTINFRQQEKSVAADAGGKWLLKLDPLEADGPDVMKIAGSNTLALEDRLVGEVWLGSGQSNMDLPVAEACDINAAHDRVGDPAKDAESDAYNFNVASFYAKWLADIRIDQTGDGNLSAISPVAWPLYEANLVWPSVMTILPDWLHDFYGDRRVLEANYSAMKRWLDFQCRANQKADFTVDRNAYGDWCDVSTNGVEGWGDGTKRRTSRPLISTAYHYHNIRIKARAAGLLGETEDVRHYETLARQVGDAFNRRFFNPITISSYGDGTRPLIDRQDATGDNVNKVCIRLKNIAGYKITGLEFARFGRGVFGDFDKGVHGKDFVWIEDCYFHDALYYHCTGWYTANVPSDGGTGPDYVFDGGVWVQTRETADIICLSNITVTKCRFERVACAINVWSGNEWDKNAENRHEFRNVVIDQCTAEVGKNWQFVVHSTHGGRLSNS